METNQQSTKAYFKLIAYIHLSLLLGIILFGVVAYFFIADFQHPDTSSPLAGLLVYLVPGLIIAGIIASNIIFRLKVNGFIGNENLKTKLTGYREALMIRYALLEAPALFTLAAICMTNNSNFMVYAGLMVVLMATKRPTKKAAIADLALDQQEIAALDDPTATGL